MYSKYACYTSDRSIKIFNKEIGPVSSGNALIRIDMCGICGTDVHMWNAGSRYVNVVPGHEACGTIIEISEGDDSLSLKRGDRVSIFPAIPCGECELCKRGLRNLCLPPGSMGLGCSLLEPGVFSEYIVYPIRYLYKLPDSVSDQEGAFIEPLSVALRAVNHAHIKVGQSVVISGAGIIGLLTAQLCRISGAGYICITDVDDERLSHAVKMGDVTISINSRKENLVTFAQQNTNGGFDCFIDCSGAGEAINYGINALKKGMRCICIGLNFEKQMIDTYNMILREIEIKGSFGQTEKDFEDALYLIAEDRINIKKYISGTITMEELQGFFEGIFIQKAKCCKMLMKP